MNNERLTKLAENISVNLTDIVRTHELFVFFHTLRVQRNEKFEQGDHSTWMLDKLCHVLARMLILRVYELAFNKDSNKESCSINEIITDNHIIKRKIQYKYDSYRKKFYNKLRSLRVRCAHPIIFGTDHDNEYKMGFISEAVDEIKPIIQEIIVASGIEKVTLNKERKLTKKAVELLFEKIYLSDEEKQNQIRLYEQL
ncbi:MAG: hypothetical protein INF43_05670 [Alphaproteobacteria bacterium]|nr:hypothetical protein [Alphaproteobacteria bacterium]